MTGAAYRAYTRKVAAMLATACDIYEFSRRGAHSFVAVVETKRLEQTGDLCRRHFFSIGFIAVLAMICHVCAEGSITVVRFAHF